MEPPPQPEYSVCVALNDALVIKEATIDQWMQKSDFEHEMSTLVKSHNDEFNKKGLKRGSQANNQGDDSRPAKRLCVASDPLPLDKFETDHPERHSIGSELEFLFNIYILYIYVYRFIYIYVYIYNILLYRSI